MAGVVEDLALPAAFLLCVVVAWALMRSFRYALVSVLPTPLVVAWLYAFMYLFGYAINPVTATLAAIAIGVGVDFAMHLTMRFREELDDRADRLDALRRAGEGTGAALAISALTSMAGFMVMVMAISPMPIFGILTAAMIFLSLVPSLLVLPSLLIAVTPPLKHDQPCACDETAHHHSQHDCDSVGAGPLRETIGSTA